MSLQEPIRNQKSTTKVGATLELAREAKESLGKILKDEGINIGIGLERLAQGTFGVTLRVQPVHRISTDQLTRLNAIQEHQGVPVSLVNTGDISARKA